MQTFVPYGIDFQKNANVLDRQRLGKQRVEGYQILKSLTDYTYGWKSHPAVKMWSGYVDGLAIYTATMCTEWLRRGYKDSLLPIVCDYIYHDDPFYPGWLYDEDVMISHRSNLIRKLPEYYGPIWPDVPDNLPYLWPISQK